jgi:hypothetical protein
MSVDRNQQISHYLDDELTAAELSDLQEWLLADASHREEFATIALLHNQLHGHLSARVAMDTVEPENLVQVEKSNATVRGFSLRLAPVIAIAGALLLMFLFWRGDNAAVAAHAELEKVIAANQLTDDRTYLLQVETNEIGGARQRRKPNDEQRPPKPPLNGARLCVRGNHKFVLQRSLENGDTFLTGCDGVSSWSVPQKGAVRVSSDPQEFNRDVPGHEYSMSLCQLDDALKQLSIAYEIFVVPSEETDAASDELEATRLLVATKRKGFRGPRRVEITYQQKSRLLEQIRFIDMPYGEDRMTVRMSLIDLTPLPNNFFQHDAHHTPDRKVVRE